MAIVISGPSNNILVNGSSVVTEAEAASPVLDASYHIYNGQVSLSNSVTTTGFSTTLYTGNGTTQSITTGVDMDTQWGNDASEKFGGLVWAKCRSIANSHYLVDTVRGASNNIYSNATNAQEALNSITAFSSNGFAVINTAINTNLSTNAAWVFQTTHRVSGTTNHGKAFTCHYNPFTGFTIVKYEGSGIVGHEIPHYLGRKLGFVTVKNISADADWVAQRTENTYMYLNKTNVELYNTGVINLMNDSIIGINTSTPVFNTSGNTYILYGWANSYFDEKNTLIGNYEIGVYQGTGASGNKVTTRGKPAWVMIKRLDSTGNWVIIDNQRTGDKGLHPNLSNAESGAWLLTLNSDGFTINSTVADDNASGGQYLYMVVYDNDSGSGKSKYPKATDTSTLNLNAHVPFANGIDTTGSKVSIAYKNETITLSNSLAQGKNYIALLNNGSYIATPYEPMYSMRNRSKAGETPDYFDLGKQKWFETTGGSELVTNGTFDTTTSGWTATNATLSIDNARIKVTTTTTSLGIASQSIATTIGKTYRIKLGVYGGTQAAYWTVGTTVGGTDIIPYQASVASGSFVSFNLEFVATSTTTYINLMANNGAIGYTALFDNVSCFEATPTVGTAIAPRNYLDCIVYADQNGQPEYVEQIEKVQYFDAVKANDFRGKNACTAWVNFDGTTTPPTIRDSYNVSAVIRTATGTFDVYFKEPMDNANYVCTGMARDNEDDFPGLGVFRKLSDTKTTSVFRINTYYTTSAYNSNEVNIQIFGGRN